MTAKRFTSSYNGDESLITHFLENGKPMTKQEVLNRLNELHDENNQLKQAYTQLKHRHSLLHDECIDAECDRDSYRKDIASLEKENEQLKKRIDRIDIILDDLNGAEYISRDDAIKALNKIDKVVR